MIGRKYAILYVATFLCVLLEATILHHLSIFRRRPELVFVFAVFWALEAPPEEVVFHAWITGLLKDMFSASPLGGYAVLFAFIAYLISIGREYLYRESLLTLFLVSLVFQIAVNIIYGFFFLITGANLSYWQLVEWTLVISAYSSVLGLFVLRPLVYFERFLGFKRYTM